MESPKRGPIHQYSGDDRLDADYISCHATQNLFGWHAQWDEGLWLAERPEDLIEAIRAFQSHQWLKAPWFDSDSDDEDGGEDKDSTAKRVVNIADIMKWREDVSMSERSRKRARAHNSL